VYVWIDGDFDKMTMTSGFCRSFLPKSGLTYCDSNNPTANPNLH